MKTINLIAIMFFLGVGLCAQTSVPPAAGDGSSTDPYQIASLGNLYWIAEANTRWGFHYIQTEDIDASATVNWFGGEGWNPIGSYVSYTDYNPFTGVYDGQHKSIQGLFINRPGQSRIGLFLLISEAILRNIRLVNVSVTGGASYTGSLCGYVSNSSVENCSSSGSVTGSSDVGGLAGYLASGSITESHSNCVVQGTASNVGGLVGSVNSSELSFCFSGGDVTGGPYGTGGLAGTVVYDSSVSNCYSTANVNGTNKVGGLCGNFNVYGSGFLINSYSIGCVDGHGTDIGGLNGWGYGSVTNCYWNIETTGQTSSFGGEGRTTVQMTYPHAANTYVGWDFASVWCEDEDYGTNDGYPYLLWQNFNPDPDHDLVAVSVTGNTEPGVGVASQYVVSVSNNGIFTEDTYTVKLLLDGNQEISAVAGTAIGPDETQVFTLAWVPTAPGSMCLRGRVAMDGDENPQNDFTPNLNVIVQPPGAIAGFVRTASNAPIMGATVSCGDASATTGGSGSYNLPIATGTYDVTASHPNYEPTTHTDVSVTNGQTTTLHFVLYPPVSNDGETVPALQTALLGNHPNPFGSSTSILYSLKESGQVRVAIYNLKGELVRNLVNEGKNPGQHSIAWSGRDDEGRPVANGVYYCSMSVGNYRSTRKLILIK